jgi:hypothetical protein
MPPPHQGLFGRHLHVGQRIPLAGLAHQNGTIRFGKDVLFHEYFHGDSGAGVGASHQTGWTGIVTKLIQQSGEGRDPKKRKSVTVVPNIQTSLL